MAHDVGVILPNWLRKKLDQGQNLNLVWRNKEEGIFQIPWNGKDSPNWEDEYLLFKEWAERDEKVLDSILWPTLKSNFRNVLNKSNHIAKVSEELKKQTDNCVVYRFLSKQEVLDKIANTKKKQQKTTSKSRKTNSADKAAAENQDSKRNDVMAVTADVESTSNQEMLMEFSASNEDIEIQRVTTIQNNDAGYRPGESEIIADVSMPQVSMTMLECALETCNLPTESLHFYTVLVKYRKLVTFQQHYDLRNPIRIFYGDGFKQVVSIVGHCDIPVFPKQFETDPVELPKCTEKDKKVQQCLGGFRQGLVLRTDQQGNLLGTRYCEAHVYCYEQSQRGDIISLQRKAEQQLFNHEMLIEYLQYPNNCQPKSQVELSIGNPPFMHDIVTITITSHAASKFLDFTDSGSLFKSNPDTLDEVVAETQSMSLEETVPSHK